MRTATILALALFCGGPAAAAEVSVGLGLDNLLGHDSRAASLGWQVGTGPLGSLGPVGFGLAAALEGDTDGDLWAGGGFTAVWPIDGRWRVGGSLMAGYYAFGTGNDLGSDLEFRTRLGVSRAIAPPWRLGLAIEHKSNGGVGRVNPGVETIFVTLGRSF